MPYKIVWIFLTVFGFCLIACSPGFNSRAIETSNDSKLDAPNDNSDFHPPPADDDVPPPVIISPAPEYCSKLDLVGVQWPVELGISGRSYLGLALNITGSFEGRSGWANLSDNFDGMGFSIGLLQQNLGMGSLQPMLMDVLNKVNRGEDFAMDAAYTGQMRTMLSQWDKDKLVSAKLVNEADIPDHELFYPDSKVISKYDISDSVQQDSFEIGDIAPTAEIKGISSANKNAVAWALKTVYSDGGSTFKPGWEDNLTRMAQSKPYVGLQLKYAMKLYSQAFGYFKAFQLTNLSHFLLMFDFVVQNGGFKKAVFDQYSVKLKVKPNMSAEEKALLILELRLKDVLPRWQSDVSARKKAIIFSEGTVHGAKRILKDEFCYSPESTVLTQP